MAPKPGEDDGLPHYKGGRKKGCPLSLVVGLLIVAYLVGWLWLFSH